MPPLTTPPTAQGSRHMNRLTYTEMRSVEEVIRKRWGTNGYVGGYNDVKLAEEATRVLNRPVLVTNVQFVREACALHEAKKALRTRLFDQATFDRLEQVLADEGVVILSRRQEHIRVWHREGFQTMTKQGKRVGALTAARHAKENHK